MPIIAVVIVVVLALGTGAYMYTSKEETTTETSVANNRPVAASETEAIAEEPDSETEPASANTVVGAEAATEIDPEPITGAEPEVVIDPEPTTVFVDGTYNTQTTYLTPSRSSHSMDITLTVTNDIVTNSSIVYDNGDGPSNSHQRSFDSNYKVEVVGAALTDIDLARVSGASLTTEAFNEGVANIETEARS